MKTVEISEASLAKYGRKETWVHTRCGKPVAAVAPLSVDMDAETFGLSHNPAFIEGFNRAWLHYQQHGGTSLEDVEGKFWIKPKTKSRVVRKPARRSR